MRDQRSLSPSPARVAGHLSYEMVRCFAAVHHMLNDNIGAPGWTPDEVADELLARVSQRVHEMVVVFGADEVGCCVDLLAEAVDNLGHGLQLEPDRVPAFGRLDDHGDGL